MLWHNPIFIPGPTNIPEILRRGIDIASMDHRSDDFVAMLKPALEGVKRILRSKTGEVLLFPATGTGAWEAAITNTLSPGDTVLAARYGMFSDRWIDLCERHGIKMQVIEAEWGTGAPADAFERALRQDREGRIKAVLVTHNETATGVVSDIAAVRQALNAAQHSAMLFVDGVSSIGSMDFRMEDWGVDIAITGSQKGFMLPAGLAILGISPKARAAIETAKCPRCFFDFRDMLKSNAVGRFPYTPPVPLIKGLAMSVELIEAEGLDNVIARHARIAEGVRRAVAAWGLELCAKEPQLYSNTVSAVLTPPGFDAAAVVTHAAAKYQVAFGVGLGKLAGKAFRIGHLGAMSDAMALSGIATMEMVLADLGLPIRLGAGTAAAQEFYRAGGLSLAKAA